MALESLTNGKQNTTLLNKHKQKISIEVFIQHVDQPDNNLAIVSFQRRNQSPILIHNSFPNITWEAEISPTGKLSNAFISDSADDFLSLPPGTIGHDLEKYFSYVEPQYINKIKNAISNGIAHPGTIYSTDYELTKADGKTIWVSSKGRATVENNKTQIVGFTHDITEQKAKDKELLESKQKLELFFSQSLTGFFFMMLDEPVEWNESTDKEKTLDYVFSHQRITKINKAMLDQYGATEKQMLGLTPNDLFSNDTAYGKKLWTELFDKGQLHTNTTEYKLDGSPIDIEGDYICIYDDKSRISGHFGIQMDITKQKRAIRQLDENEQKYRTLVEASHESIFIIQDSVIKYVNNELLRLLGYAATEMIGTPFIEFVAPEERIRVQDFFKKRHSEEVVPNRYESIALTKLGENVAVEVSTSEIQFNGHPALMVILRDIIDRKKSESVQQLLFEISEFASLNISLKDFISKVHLQLNSIIRADNLYIAIYHKDLDKYSFPYFVDEYDHFESTELFSLENTLTDHIRKTGKGQLITKEIEEELFGKDQFNLIGEYSLMWLGTPLIDSSTNEVIGVIAIQDYHNNVTYTSENLVTLEIIANHIGLFIDRYNYLDALKKAKAEAEEGEQRYKSLFNDNSSVMLIIDPETESIIDANEAACAFYGYELAELTNLKIDQINRSDKEFLDSQIQLAREKRKNQFFTQHRLANGILKDVEIRAGGIVVNGKPCRYSIVHDITKQKEAQDEILRLYKAIEQSPTPVALADLKGYFTYINPRFCELSEYSKEELIGQHTRILKSGLQSDDTYKTLWETINSGNIWKGELSNKKKSGELYLEAVSIGPVLNEYGETTHFVKVGRDITAQRKMQNDLIAAKEKAEESDRLKSAFLANISHEIRTPMNAIMGFSSILMEDTTNPTHTEYLNIIYNSTSRLLGTLTDMMELSKIEAGQMKIFYSVFDLNELLLELFNFHKKNPKSIGLNIKMAVDDMLFINSDKTKLYQIMSNLLSNAQKFTVDGSVDFGYRVENTDLFLYVKDSGIGIPAKYHDRIFNRFFQVDAKYSREYDGTGLGLAIVKQLVELINGKIWLESEPKKGTTFYIRLADVIRNVQIATAEKGVN